MIHLLVSFLVFTAYVGLVTLKFGVLPSVSDSYYHIKNKALFTLALFAFSFSAILSGGTLLMMLAGSGICFVAAAPDFRIHKEGDVHFISAISGIVFGMLSMWFDFGYWWIVVIMASGSIAIRLRLKNYTFYIEVLAFYLIMLGLLLNLIKL